MTSRESGIHREPRLNRRELLGRLAAAGTAGFIGSRVGPAGAEPPPETTRLRVHHSVSLCLAPQYVAEDLLRNEGFTEVEYVRPRGPTGFYEALSAGEADLGNDFAPMAIIRLDRGEPLVVLAGVHVGCFELFGTERVRAVHDLKGKTVGVRGLESPPHVFLASMVAHVGLDPRKDIAWATYPSEESMRRLARGEIDAFMGFPPEPQRLRAKQIGHVVVNSAVDRPWAQYFCCMTIANREFARKNPVAAKRALRAMLKATDLCALEPDRAARTLVNRRITPSYDDAIQTMKDVVYTKWREYQPEDTLRFYALRLHEAGMIKTSPQKILAQGTDWRYLNDLKKELKG